jgi:hypothetical protein
MIELTLYALAGLACMAAGWWLCLYWNQEAVVEQSLFNTNSTGPLYALYEEVLMQWRYKGGIAMYGRLTMNIRRDLHRTSIVFTVHSNRLDKDFHRMEVSGGDSVEERKFIAGNIIEGFERHIVREISHAEEKEI